MKVLLVYSPYYFGPPCVDTFPLGMGYLSAAIKPYHDVQAYSFSDFRTGEKSLAEISGKFKPDVVGFTCNTFNRGGVKRMIRLARALRSDVHIVVGGVHASTCYKQMLENYGADIVVLGEGDKTIIDLCKALETRQPLADVKGIAYRENGHVIVTQSREPILDLDELPMPDYSYAREFMEKSKMGFLITSRGCPVRCHFCSTSSFWGQKVRMNSPSRVVDEMEMLVNQYGVEKIFFHDDAFNLGVGRVKAICDEIVKRKLHVKWGCSCRVVPVNEEMLSAMVDAGCRHIGWGVESGSAEVLQRIGKKVTLDQIINAFDLSSKYSALITISAFLMVGNPGESENTVNQTFEFLRGLPMNDFSGVAMLYVLPGTLLYENLLKEMKIREELWTEYDSVPYYTLEHSLLTLHRWAQILCGYTNKLEVPSEGRFWGEILGNRSFFDRIGYMIWPPPAAYSTFRKLLPGKRIKF